MLDLCCGWGRHARLLAERGYQVTGVDLNAAALAEARRQSIGGVTYIEHDMRDLADLPGSYDAVISLWQSFDYFDEATNRAILRQINRKLSPRGRLILDLYHYHRGFFERHQGTRSLERDGLTIVETKLMHGNRLTVQLDHGADRGADTFEWQLYTPDEIRDLAEACGLECRLICSGFDEGLAAAADHPRMQLVFEKQ